MTLTAQALFPRAAGEPEYLAQLGARVRTWRAQHGLSRKQLAKAAGVSERYLAQLEAGNGNFSIALLRNLAHAMHWPLGELVREESHQRTVELELATQMLARLPPTRLRQAYRWLLKTFGASRFGRIALVGLRGAGKSSLGTALAKELGAPFVELDRRVEQEAGTNLSEIFSLYGQEGFRRFERRALERAIAEMPNAVIAVGGSLVTDAQNYELLRSSCYVIWIKAKPEEHMSRVIAQGDLRPMRGHAQAMQELRGILAEREVLYAQADATLDTAGKPLKRALAELRALLPQQDDH